MTAPAPTRAPHLVHFVVKTARAAEMISWYGTVFGATVVHEDRRIAFLTWDEESHRLALVKLPRALRLLFPLSKLRRKVYGVDHLAFSLASLDDLLTRWSELRSIGVEPVWAINHGPTTSLYYEDPDGTRLELQVENFATAGETADFFSSPEFAANPIGVLFDPAYLLERLRAGEPEAVLLRQGAGVRPGETPVSGRRAVTLRTL